MTIQKKLSILGVFTVMFIALFAFFPNGIRSISLRSAALTATGTSSTPTVDRIVTITPSNPKVGDYIAVRSPAMNKSWHRDVTIKLVNSLGEEVKEFAGKQSSFTYEIWSEWKIPGDISPGEYRFVLFDNYYGKVIATSDVIVVQGNDIIISPLNVSEIRKGEVLFLRWSTNNVASVNIDIYDQYDKKKATIASKIPSSETTRNYIIPTTLSSEYKNYSKYYIRISDASNPSSYYDSEKFTIYESNYNHVTYNLGNTRVSKSPLVFTLCANEGEVCSFTGTKDIVYGAYGLWATPQTPAKNGGWTAIKTSSVPVICSSAVFGDPAKGTKKSCYTQDSVNNVTIIAEPTDVGIGQNTTFTWENTAWTSLGGVSDTLVDVDVVNSAGAVVQRWFWLKNVNTVTWTVPNNMPIGNYRFTVADRNNYNKTVTSKEFKIFTNDIIISPLDISQILTGQKLVIDWTTNNIAAINVDLYQGSTKKATILSNLSTGNTTTEYTIPTDRVVGTGYKIRISNAQNPSIYSESQEFEIKDALIAEYVFCANEGQTCTFTGTKDIRYGANGRWSAVKTGVTSPIACNNRTFGDPIKGTRKACYIKDSTVIAN